MNRINVSDVIDESKVGGFQIFILLLSAICVIMDGFDVQAMGYVAPTIINEWHISKATLGPIFGAGLLGMAIGPVTFGMVADGVGRRPVLIGATLLLAVSMGWTAFAISPRELLVLRFVTGLGMGTIIPNAVALVGEFSPARIRVTFMMAAASGFVAGGALGGALAAVLIPEFGWRSVFVCGSAAAAIVAIVMIVSLPESLQFLVLNERGHQRIRRSLRRIAPSLVTNVHTVFVVREQRKDGVPFASLFKGGLGTGTALLWIISFMNLLCAYFLANWLPVVMNEAGHSASQAVMASTVFWIGGLVGCLFLGWLIDRCGFGPVLTMAFLLAAFGIAAVGQVASSLPITFVVLAATGFCVLGTPPMISAAAATYYPTAIRSTGMGWTLGIGRLGSIFGPVVGGQLMQLGWSTGNLFYVAAAPVLLATIASIIFWKRAVYSLRVSDAVAPTNIEHTVTPASES